MAPGDTSPPVPTRVSCLAFSSLLTWHIHNPALHIGDDTEFGVKGHTGVNGTALIPNAAQHQATREVFRVSSGHCPCSLTGSLGSGGNTQLSRGDLRTGCLWVTGDSPPAW